MLRKCISRWAWGWGNGQTLTYRKRRRNKSAGGSGGAEQVDLGVGWSLQVCLGAEAPPCCREIKKTTQRKCIRPDPLAEGKQARRNAKPRRRFSRAGHPPTREKTSKLNIVLCVSRVGSHKESLLSNIGLSAGYSLPHRVGGSFAMGTAAEPPYIRSYYSSARKPAPCFLFLAAGRPIRISHC